MVLRQEREGRRLGEIGKLDKKGRKRTRNGGQWQYLGYFLFFSFNKFTHTKQCQHAAIQFFTYRMPFLLPNQHHQSTEGKIGNESVPKIILNDTTNVFFVKTVISMLVISNHVSFRVLFDKIVSVYFMCIMFSKRVLQSSNVIVSTLLRCKQRDK